MVVCTERALRRVMSNQSVIHTSLPEVAGHGRDLA